MKTLISDIESYITGLSIMVRTLMASAILLNMDASVYAQEFDYGKFWVKITDSTLFPIENHLTTNDTLNGLFDNYNVTSFKKAYPSSKTSELLKIHEVKCECNIDSLIMIISELFTGRMGSFSKFLNEGEKVTFDPSDYMWFLTSQDPTEWLWHLKITQSDLAWDIARGSPEVKIAIIDYNVDVSHPDLVTKLVNYSDPYDGSSFVCNPTGVRWHGTAVAGFAGAETVKDCEIAQGQFASSGFNSTIVFYNSPPSRQVFLQKALHASNVMGAKIITSCAGSSLLCSPNLSTGEDLVMQEILNNGTAIIMPAGNGLNGTHCGTNVPDANHAFYPFHPSYDERIIIVSSTGKDDRHRYFNSNNQEHTHSHFAEVDICAPGHQLMATLPTECDPNSWPYYGGLGGTSFATPIASSIASLLYSINPELTPSEVQDILRQTADPILDEGDFSGVVGAGRVNAFRAVSAVCPPNEDIVVCLDPNGQNFLSCTSNQFITEHPFDKTYFSKETVLSDAAINELNNDVEFVAGSEVRMVPPFRVTATSCNTFRAHIRSCTDSNHHSNRIGLEEEEDNGVNADAEKSELEYIVVFPNPNSGTFTIAGQNMQGIAIMDATGKLVRKLHGPFTGPTEISGLGSGLYLVRVHMPDGSSETARVIVAP